MSKIIIEDYNPLWQIIFEREKQLLKLGLPNAVVIEHIGSTSVHGLSAKPVIDIMIGVTSLALADAQYIESIKNLGYVYVPEYEKSIPDRRYFRKKNEVHIHLVELNSTLWKRHIRFRDYLRTHPESVREYAELKKNLVEQFTDTNEYAGAKTEFIQRIEALADKAS